MNSLTANNRLSQQLVVSVAEHLLLRHECRLPNHLAVSNHRELYLTVVGELCRNLTAGFVTEEGYAALDCRWEPETQRVIYLRKDYPHECFSPLWKFRRDFVECEGPPAH